MNEDIQKVSSPAALKAMSYRELCAYCGSMRQYICTCVRKSGGHLASSLGAVELAVALHYVFDCPTDKILWDVGHQAYAHKIITGRAEAFAHLRENGGISGFPKMSESECDAFTMGHSSTSLSVGLGYARARDLRGENYQVVSVIGDGAFTGGMAFEALNDIGSAGAKMIVVLNDNKMSISRNVGAMSEYLSKLRLSKRYMRFKRTVKKGVLGIPLFGAHVYRALDKTKDGFKSLLQNNKMFEQMGIKYYGPIDGHNLGSLIDILRDAKAESGPVLIHIVTEKGKGDRSAESDPSRFHGISPQGAESEQSYAAVLSRFLCEEGARDPRVVAITAAMADGTGVSEFASAYPHRCFDVGIAEQHAVTLAAGLAAGGMKPYFAVYSTFLQRGFDQILHDVCLNKLNVTFCIDRAGAVGADGVTHQGIYDLGYLSMIPDLTVLAPKDGEEFAAMLRWSLSFHRPLAIRYPKSYAPLSGTTPFVSPSWEVLRACQSGNYALCVGGRALAAAMQTENVTVVNARSVKPLDTAFLSQINQAGNRIVTVEDGAKSGGFGQAVATHLLTLGLRAHITNIGYGDAFLDDFSVEHSLVTAGITPAGIQAALRKA